MKATYTQQLNKLIISTALLSALAGCGQSGRLYLPEQQAEQNQPQKSTDAVILNSQTNDKQQEQ